MPRIKHHRSSRRVPPPKDSDFDHEINLVDKSEAEEDSLGPPTAGPSSSLQDSARESPLGISGRENGDANNTQTAAADEEERPRPSIQINEPTPLREGLGAANDVTPRKKSLSKKKAPESAIEILYENQRGGFLCGIPLFSSKALGNLDPPPWTNYAHKASPTDINTAQVPDPSWEWAWPEWKINRDDKVDDDGWEYSFAFSRKFSWHKARWWNSFVRRRAWIRKRVRKDSGYIAQDPHMLNPEYFTIRPSSEISRERERSSSRMSKRTASPRGSRLSMSTTRSDGLEQPEDIEHVDELLAVLRTSRIDREKIEAVDNYLEHAQEDLAGLQEVMHEIMSLFVFQASRRVLLTRLTEIHDRTVAQSKKKGKDADGELQRRAKNLAEAVKHADEEVRKLEYWSDVKGMAEEGESTGAVDRRKGWGPSWQGVDKSGPSEPAPPSPEAKY
ncbi:putative PEX23-like peroxisomal biogenesis factor 23-like protein [Triangularia verruculosa]|uniref:PEX23-like peroxisomal biogenesis factor 23-like protein n=1 Tax=Triangularia verruculosa TaxID=2587418 RepID=A0AAN7AS56_9PEZI|nr:putative PEX23-like peroxisomal biogenesis factor 23-like protein [Triangularia verruculosa]